MNPRAHLSKDKQLKKILINQDDFKLTRKKNIHLHLCSSIMSQQLSTQVARIIYTRFLGLFEQNNPTAQDILNVPFETLRAIGLSNAKTNYIRNVCAYFIEEKLTDSKLHRMSAEDVMEKLLKIKGVGRWTVEMLQMFTLGYEDVFALDDLGIQQAMTRLYNLDASDKKKFRQSLIEISNRWSPYRTYACLYLWGFKDN
jgi:DNA-3-methyladenine glycosylase II